MSGDGAYGRGKRRQGGGVRGPYGTNDGDIWSGEDSTVGKMLKDREGLVLIHEVLDGEERIYNVAEDNPDPEMQDLLRRARAGVDKYLAAQAEMN